MATTEQPVQSQESSKKSSRLLAPIRAIPRRYRASVREKAITRAKTRIIVAGGDPAKMNIEDLEVVVREEEDKIKGAWKERGILALLALLGLNLFH